jgi:hypothetical protein
LIVINHALAAFRSAAFDVWPAVGIEGKSEPDADGSFNFLP